MPRSQSERIVDQACRRAAGSKPVVGSSRNTRSGSPTSASARSSRRRWPPDRLRARASRFSAQLDELDQLVDRAAARVVAAVHLDQLGHGQVVLHAALLEHDPHALAQLAAGRAPDPCPARWPRPRCASGNPRGSRQWWSCRRRSARADRTPRPARPRSSPRAQPPPRRRTCADRAPRWRVRLSVIRSLSCQADVGRHARRVSGERPKSG